MGLTLTHSLKNDVFNAARRDKPDMQQLKKAVSEALGHMKESTLERNT